MFSRHEKQRISKAVEDIIREINHPEMDNDNIRFQLHVDGKESWSWADIHENAQLSHTPNSWNEVAREVLNDQND